MQFERVIWGLCRARSLEVAALQPARGLNLHFVSASANQTGVSAPARHVRLRLPGVRAGRSDVAEHPRVHLDSLVASTSLAKGEVPYLLVSPFATRSACVIVAELEAAACANECPFAAPGFAICNA